MFGFIESIVIIDGHGKLGIKGVKGRMVTEALVMKC